MYLLSAFVVSIVYCCVVAVGVSAQSFINAYTLTSSTFNVQLATPEVRHFLCHPSSLSFFLFPPCVIANVPLCPQLLLCCL